MELENIESIIEAILFAAGDTIESNTLVQILEIDKNRLLKIMDNLIQKYNNENRGLEIIVVEDSYQIRTNPKYFEFVKKLRDHKTNNGLSQAALETLAIIAYKQPITKPEVEAIRGVGCYTSVLRLMEYELIKETGRMDAPGKPIIYQTTEEFLKAFGFTSLKDLPSIEIFLDKQSSNI